MEIQPTFSLQPCHILGFLFSTDSRPNISVNPTPLNLDCYCQLTPPPPPFRFCLLTRICPLPFRFRYSYLLINYNTPTHCFTRLPPPPLPQFNLLNPYPIYHLYFHFKPPPPPKKKKNYFPQLNPTPKYFCQPIPQFFARLSPPPRFNLLNPYPGYTHATYIFTSNSPHPGLIFFTTFFFCWLERMSNKTRHVSSWARPCWI